MLRVYSCDRMKNLYHHSNCSEFPYLSMQRNTGWKYQKRPGVDALLTSLLDHFEIVLFTSENAMVILVMSIAH